MAETKSISTEQVVGNLLEGEGLDVLRESLSWGGSESIQPRRASASLGDAGSLFFRLRNWWNRARIHQHRAYARRVRLHQHDGSRPHPTRAGCEAFGAGPPIGAGSCAVRRQVYGPCQSRPRDRRLPAARPVGGGEAPCAGPRGEATATSVSKARNRCIHRVERRFRWHFEGAATSAGRLRRSRSAP